MPGVMRLLMAAPHRFAFTQAVRVLEHYGALETARASAPGQWRARFVTDASMRRQATPLTAASVDEPARLIRLQSSGFALAGAAGVLPYSYGAIFRSQTQLKNPSLKAFIDILQHRPTHLFYRAAIAGEAALGPEHALRGDADPISDTLRGLCGLSQPAQSGHHRKPDAWIMRFASLLAARTRSIAGLEALLTAAAGIPMRVTPLTGRWTRLPEDELTRLGDPPDGRNTALGVNAMLGQEAWVVNGYFEMRTTPVATGDLDRWWPDGALAAVLAELCDLYCGLTFRPSLRVIVRRDSVPHAQLARGSDHPAPPGCRLGQASWLTSSLASSRADADRDDFAYDLTPPQAHC